MAIFLKKEWILDFAHSETAIYLPKNEQIHGDLSRRGYLFGRDSLR